jgi:2,4-dienoyl-CoA reductase-like NADH-dependent reductase (Old Yellow Enzyme family)
MPDLFEQTSVCGMKLRNRFVRSATWEGMADKDGAVTDKLIDTVVALAQGEVGLIISSYSFVSREGQSSPGQVAVYDDRFNPGLRKMAAAVHEAGGKIALQLVHGGCNADAGLAGTELVGPSAVNEGGETVCREATVADLAASASDFARAAGRAKAAGFDAVQIHAAHGFLLSQFLTPAFNKRTDSYGGPLENRARLLIGVVGLVRETVGPAFPILVKLNSEDFIECGLTREESVRVSVMLEKASADAIELSGGTKGSPDRFRASRRGPSKPGEPEPYFIEAARLYKRSVSVPLMLVGGIRSYNVAEDLVRSGTADYISMSRPLICEPALVKRWREGDRRPAECVSDSACFGPASDGRGLYCVTQPGRRAE